MRFGDFENYVAPRRRALCSRAEPRTPCAHAHASRVKISSAKTGRKFNLLRAQIATSRGLCAGRLRTSAAQVQFFFFRLLRSFKLRYRRSKGYRISEI